jgi:hypothetical protein
VSEAEPLGAIAELRAVWTRGLPPLDAAMAD